MGDETNVHLTLVCLSWENGFSHDDSPPTTIQHQLAELRQRAESE
jgi:hypothetical protein